MYPPVIIVKKYYINYYTVKINEKWLPLFALEAVDRFKRKFLIIDVHEYVELFKKICKIILR